MYHLSHKVSDDPNGWFGLAGTPRVLQSFLNVIRGTSHSIFRQNHRAILQDDSSVTIQQYPMGEMNLRRERGVAL
jgi:hypothetical protein